MTWKSILALFAKGEIAEFMHPVMEKQNFVRRATSQKLRRSVLLALLVTVCCYGCKHSTSRSIALLTQTTGVPLWDAAHAGALSGAVHCGLRVHYDAPAREDDLQRQLALFEKFRSRSFAGLIVAPIQSRALRNPIQRAVSDGLPVVVIGTDLGIRNENLTYVLNDERIGGQLAAEKLNELLHGKGAVAMMGLDLNRPSSLERASFVEAAITRNYKNLQITERLKGSVNVAQEEQIAQQILSKSTHTDAIIALSAAATRGAYYAAMSRPPGKHVFIIGFDQDLYPPLRAGQIDSVIAQHARLMGQLASEAICDKLAGRPMNGRITVAPFVITAANINSNEIQTKLNQDWWSLQQE